MHDLYHNVATVQLLNPANATTAKTSSSVDLQGFGSASIVFLVGQSGDTLSGSLYWTLKLQDSPDNSAFTDVAASGVLNGSATYVLNASGADQKAYGFGYIGNQRYVRAVATPTGSISSGMPVGVLALKGNASLKPVA
jgi:hypothetical protein